MRMKTGHRQLLVALVAGLAIAALGFVVGALLTRGSGQFAFDTASRSGGDGVEQSAPQPAVPPNELGAEQYSDEAAPDAKGTSADRDRMVIRTEGMELRVEDVEPAVDEVRAIAGRFDADITDLQVIAGIDPGPIPLGERGVAEEYPSPSRAFITLRVPAEKLDALRSDIASNGTVLSQTSSSSDVGQEHADLSARLKNLQAQEARLREFFDQATKVTDLLAIEQELSRVRGEIESLQAQIEYLERQVARATLTVTLTERGPVVRPEAGDWGFVEAITRGIQAAAALLGILITGLIAIAPLALIAVLVWWLVRTIRRRRSRGLGAVHTGTDRAEEGAE